MIDDVEAALGPFARDCQTSNLPVPTLYSVEVCDPLEWGADIYAQVHFGWVDQRITCSAHLEDNDEHDNLVAAIAEAGHEAVIEHILWPNIPTNWPRCPEHPDTHPLEVGWPGEVPAWVCPVSGVAVADIGQLGS